MSSTHSGKVPYKIGATFYAVLIAATVATTIVHETAHWAMGTALGHDMAMSFNAAHAVAASGVSAGHAMLITAAGPAVTFLQALIAFVLVRSRGLLLAYPFFVRRLVHSLCRGIRQSFPSERRSAPEHRSVRRDVVVASRGGVGAVRAVMAGGTSSEDRLEDPSDVLSAVQRDGRCDRIRRQASLTRSSV